MALDDVRHPDAEQLAEYADGVLDAEARAEVEAHLADCADCRAVVIETMAFLDSGASPGSTGGDKVIPFRSRRWVTGVTTGLAVAAALILAIFVGRPAWVKGLFGGSGERPELQELVAALAHEPARPVDGRLAGPFAYAPPPSPTRGPGDREIGPDVTIAAANIEKAAGSGAGGAAQGALGLGYLATGQLDKAIDTLERAAQGNPANPLFENDLAAAYLARGTRSGRADDLSRALAAADRALQLRPAFAEAAFNRALALEALHRPDETRAAWDAYLKVDAESEWAREAQRRRD